MTYDSQPKQAHVSRPKDLISRSSRTPRAYSIAALLEKAAITRCRHMQSATCVPYNLKATVQAL